MGTHLTGVIGVGEVVGVTPAGLLVGCRRAGCRCSSGGGCGRRPASIVCTRAAIHRRAVEHMDGARTVDGRVVVGDAVARGLVSLLLSLLSLVVLRCRRRRWWQRRRGCFLDHRGLAALSEEP